MYVKISEIPSTNYDDELGHSFVVLLKTQSLGFVQLWSNFTYQIRVHLSTYIPSLTFTDRRKGNVQNNPSSDCVRQEDHNNFITSISTGVSRFRPFNFTYSYSHNQSMVHLFHFLFSIINNNYVLICRRTASFSIFISSIHLPVAHQFLYPCLVTQIHGQIACKSLLPNPCRVAF